MASVHQQKGSPHWVAKVRIWVPLADHPHGGFWRRTLRTTKVPLSESKTKAKAVAEEIELTSNAAYNAGDPTAFYEHAVARMLSAAGLAPKKAMTWNSWAKLWIESQSADQKTIARYKGALDEFSEHVGVRASGAIRLITPSDCTGFHQALLKSGRAPATAALMFKVVRWAFAQAQLQGYVERNPAAFVKLDKTSEFKRKPFSKEEIGKVFAQIKKEECREWRTACLFGLYYGMRLKDATGRRYEEIKTEDGIRFLEFTPGKKKKKGRVIRLPLVGELTKLKGKGAITPVIDGLGNASKVFSRILRDAGVKVEVLKARGDGGHSQADKSFHSWRHTVNTMLVKAGVDVRLRQLISDHESQEMNAIYTHPDLVSIQGALAPLAAMVTSDGGQSRS